MITSRLLAFLFASFHSTLVASQACAPPGNKTDWTWEQIPPSRKLRWHKCFGEESLQCARLDLPMDWQEPSDALRVVLAVVRKPALNTTDYRGPIIVNPGGSGGSGISYVRNFGTYAQSVVGTNYDLIGFDPRGIGASTPRYSCFESEEERAAWNLQDPGIVDSYPDLALAGTIFARAQALAKLCEQNVAPTGLVEHSGTTYIARDMLAIVDQTGYDDLAYWGFSYGTVIGNVFAAMFPDRVRTILSDGNVDTEEWMMQKGRFYLTDAQATMNAFYEYCHAAGAKLCSFYEDSPEAIKAKLGKLLEALKAQPIIIPSSDDENGPRVPQLLSYSEVQRLVSYMVYQPYFEWPIFSDILIGLNEGDGRPYYDYYNPSAAPSPVCGTEDISPFDPLPYQVYQTEDAYGFMVCADRATSYNATLEQAVEDAKFLIDWSPATGAFNWGERLLCAGRTVRPKWRFEGPYGGITKNPILYINNRADPISPLISARNNAARFPNSIVLDQNSYGHTFLAAPSDCSTKYIYEYFQHGTLPRNGTVCESLWDPFRRYE
ncbi:alpha/beta hydrolase fold domain-containing protein [Sarocladium implicatum]|nr:alpha/beta hydrolase fold domain-containing protein [Sarocladium implicatum]